MSSFIMDQLLLAFFHVPLSLPQHEETGEKRGKAKEQEGSGDLPLEATSRDQPEQRAAKRGLG